jgi:hypothetical protein
MAGATNIAVRRRPFGGPTIASVLVSLLLFAEILLYGANASDLALGFSGLWLLALALVLTLSWAGKALGQARLAWIGFAFASVVLAGVLSLTPFAVGGAHPVWSWVVGAGLPGLALNDPPASASLDPYLTIVELIKLAALGATFLIGAIFGADDERAKSLIRWLLGLGLAYSLWAFIDRVTNPAWLFDAPRSFDPNRLSASLVSANTAATFFGALTLLNLIDLDRKFQNYRPSGKTDGGKAVIRRIDIRRLERLAPKFALPLISLAAAATCLILTLSRGGISATAAVAIILIGSTGVARARQGAMSAPAAATIAILVGIVLASFALNLGSLQDRLNFLGSDTLARNAIFAAHLAAFSAAPASGYGLGSFAHLNLMIMDQANLAVLDLLGATHNIYVQWLEQAGLVGAVPMFTCIALIALQIARGAIRRRRMRPWLVGILAVLALFLIHGASDFALEVPAMAGLLSLLLGVGCGASGLGVQNIRPDQSAQRSTNTKTAPGSKPEPGRRSVVGPRLTSRRAKPPFRFSPPTGVAGDRSSVRHRRGRNEFSECANPSPTWSWSYPLTSRAARTQMKKVHWRMKSASASQSRPKKQTEHSLRIPRRRMSSENIHAPPTIRSARLSGRVETSAVLF